MFSVKKGFRKLIRGNLEPSFYDNGFLYDPFDWFMGDIVFRAKRDNDFFVSICYLTSRYDNEIFTCEYCLNRLCTHDMTFPDLLFHNMARIGQLITQEEKKAMFPPEVAKESIVDTWWRVFSEEEFIDNIRKYVDFVIGCVERFDTSDRRKAVLASKEMNDRVLLINEVYENTLKKRFSPIKNEEFARKLKRNKTLLDIGQALQYVAEKRGLELTKYLFPAIVEDCYKMHFVKYPEPKRD